MADLDDILPPGSYKLDLVDRTSTPLGLTVDAEIGTLRNAGTSESDDLDDGPLALAAARATCGICSRRTCARRNSRSSTTSARSKRDCAWLTRCARASRRLPSRKRTGSRR